MQVDMVIALLIASSKREVFTHKRGWLDTTRGTVVKQRTSYGIRYLRRRLRPEADVTKSPSHSVCRIAVQID